MLSLSYRCRSVRSSISISLRNQYTPVAIHIFNFHYQIIRSSCNRLHFTCGIISQKRALLIVNCELVPKIPRSPETYRISYKGSVNAIAPIHTPVPSLFFGETFPFLVEGLLRYYPSVLLPLVSQPYIWITLCSPALHVPEIEAGKTGR